MINQYDLIEYFKKVRGGFYSGLFEIELNLLAKEDAAKLTDRFKYHPIIQEFAGFVLDDPNTSNHHVYLGSSPLQGSVLYLAHDDETRVVFPSLNDFLVAADAAKTQGKSLMQLHPALSPIATDQVSLSELITQIVNMGTINEVALSIIPSLDLRNFEILECLIKNDDFFLAEAVAIEIQRRPRPELLPIAELCRKHAHPQVAAAGHRALKALSIV